ncbi:protein-L-isoaspartate O-methyltransferase family protein [Microvirga sp. 2TAF3]|uniref:protein-L-isoaspartate O-methyltransferase family protein n=1 Tax=Microvirga sp. 2TAF3 TaxID=3233014 RepID=UPI003F9907F1
MATTLPDSTRLRYAERITRMGGCDDPRIEQAFAAVPRENFLPPPPWTLICAGTAIQSAELADVYENVLVAISRERGINNGEPALHAAWLSAVSPQPGDTVIHVGAGTGYYTAILSLLVQPGGRVEAYEYQQDLADAAARNLKAHADITVHAASALGRTMPDADVIYVNAGVVAPDPEWLKALRPGGRLIFPWQPHGGWGPAILVIRKPNGFTVSRLMNVGFISSSGQKKIPVKGYGPMEGDIARTRSVWLTADRQPDHSATAVYDAVWFSSESID